MRDKKYLLLILLVVLLFSNGCSTNIRKEPPQLIATVNKERIDATRGTYQWKTKNFMSNTTTVADAASPSQIAQNIKPQAVKVNSTVNVEFNDQSQPKLHAYLWDKEERTKKLSLDQNQVILPSERGKYVIEISSQWPNGDASYTLVVNVQ
ncbi:hypothetical protein GFV16_13235 [Bacillus megaterium]|uniref:hypothetical protein n=1 Tax=Priestia megaterium TaxID=1404 RepID=UPI001293CE6C|nr:hypothetical protein [Priestia megaterium]MQR86877.1 hypothetical protein [Priestia megaterium]